MESKTMSESRLNEVEIMLVHQEQQIQDLGEVIEKQWKEIDILKAKLRITEGKIEEIEHATQSGDGPPSADQKPPHY